MVYETLSPSRHPPYACLIASNRSCQIYQHPLSNLASQGNKGRAEFTVKPSCIWHFVVIRSRKWIQPDCKKAAYPSMCKCGGRLSQLFQTLAVKYVAWNSLAFQRVSWWDILRGKSFFRCVFNLFDVWKAPMYWQFTSEWPICWSDHWRQQSTLDSRSTSVRLSNCSVWHTFNLMS